MTEPRRFDLHELTGTDDPIGHAELGRAFAAARALESALAGPDARPSPELADRIMAQVGREPTPRPFGIIAALRRRPGLAGVVDSLRVGWARGLGAGRPLSVRASGLAYVAAVLVLAASLTGAAAYTTAGALGGLGLFGQPASHGPVDSPALETPGPLLSPEPSEAESAEPTESPEPSGAEPSDDQRGSGATAEPGDNNGGSGGSDDSGGPGASDDHSGDGGSGGASSETQTPKPSQSPRSSETADPSSASSDN